jgi:hypothetical protein
MALTFMERKLAQVAEALSPDNEYYAGQSLHHSPTPTEAVDHYLHHGGPEDFARREQEGKLIGQSQVGS